MLYGAVDVVRCDVEANVDANADADDNDVAVNDSDDEGNIECWLPYLRGRHTDGRTDGRTGRQTDREIVNTTCRLPILGPTKQQ